MPYLYEDTVRGDPRNALTVPSSREDVLTETFASAFEENPIMAASRWQSLREDQRTGPKLDAASARTRLKDAGMEKDLQVSDSGITEAALSTLMERKRIEKRRQETFARSEGGFAEGAERLGIAFATTLVDPISMGLNFVPVVGQVRYARWLADAGSLAARVGVRAGVGAAEGVVGAAIGELPVYAMRTQEQADYDAADSLMNVTFGGVIGAGLHTTVGSAAELFERSRGRTLGFERYRGLTQEDGELVSRFLKEAPAMDSRDISRVLDTWSPEARRAVADVLPERLATKPKEAAVDAVDRLPPDAQQAALRAAVGQAVEGRAIDVEPILRTSDAEQIVSFTTERGGSTYDVVGDTTQRVKGASGGIHEGDVGLKIRSERTVYASPESAEALGRIYAQGAPDDKRPKLEMIDAYTLRLTEWHGKNEKGEPFGKRLITDFPVSRTPEVGAHPVEFLPQGYHIGSKITGLTRQVPAPAAHSASVPDTEFQAATKAADETLAREIDPTIEANLKSAEEEASLAEADAKALLKRLGLELDDPDTAAVAEGIEKAERWARAAELATVCLVRGG